MLSNERHRQLYQYLSETTYSNYEMAKIHKLKWEECWEPAAEHPMVESVIWGACPLFLRFRVGELTLDIHWCRRVTRSHGSSIIVKPNSEWISRPQAFSASVHVVRTLHRPIHLATTPNPSHDSSATCLGVYSDKEHIKLEMSENSGEIGTDPWTLILGPWRCR
jgi:hypothetical protein